MYICIIDGIVNISYNKKEWIKLQSSQFIYISEQNWKITYDDVAIIYYNNLYIIKNTTSISVSNDGQVWIDL
jgi:hypothetical protein